MLPNSENPFAPPRETGTPSPVSDVLIWKLGLREVILALLVFLGFSAGFAVVFFVTHGSVLPFNPEEFDGEYNLTNMWGGAGVTAFFVLGILLWSRGGLFSIGGLLALAIGILMWILAAMVIVMPGGSLVVWGSALVALVLGGILLRRRTS